MGSALSWDQIAPGAADAPEEPERRPAKKTVDATETPAKKKGMWSYTLLHVVILAVVAFVLGMIIWKLLTNGGSSLERSMEAPDGPTTAQSSVFW